MENVQVSLTMYRKETYEREVCVCHYVHIHLYR